MRTFPILLTVVAAASLLGTEPSLARVEGPWCFHMSMGRGGVISRCDMPSYEACRAEQRSLGGTYCTQNPYYWWHAKGEPPRKRTARKHRQ
jgi:hypothetical protein